MLSMRSALSMSNESLSPKEKDSKNQNQSYSQRKLHEQLIKRISWKSGTQAPSPINRSPTRQLDLIREVPIPIAKQMNSTFQIPRLALSPLKSSLPASLNGSQYKIGKQLIKDTQGEDTKISDIAFNEIANQKVDSIRKSQFFSRRTQHQEHRRQISNISADIQDLNQSSKDFTSQMNKTFQSNLLSKNQRLLFGSQYGRSYQFSRGFNQVMYRDNGIGSSLMENERKIKSLIRCQQKEEERLRTQQVQNTKRAIAIEYYEKYKIFLSPKEFKTHSDKQLEMLLRDRLNTKLMNPAAIVIQKFWRQSQQRKQVKVIVRQKTKAAVRIQNFWKKVKIISLLPRTLKLRKNFAAIKVQKYLKGFLTRRKVSEDLKIFRLHTHFKFFSCLKDKIQEEVAIRMQATWRMYQAKLERQYLLELKIKQEQAKKYAAKKKQIGSKNNHLNNQINAGTNVPPLKIDKKNLGLNALNGSYKKTTQGLGIQRGQGTSVGQSSHTQISRQTSKVRDLYPDKSTENDSQKQASQRGNRKNSQTRIVINSVSPQQNKHVSPLLGSSKVRKQQPNMTNEQVRIQNNSGSLTFENSNGYNERNRPYSHEDETPQGSQKSRLLSFEQAASKLDLQNQLDDLSDDKSMNGGGAFQDTSSHNQILLEQLDELIQKEGGQKRPKIVVNGVAPTGVGASNYAAKLGALDKIKEESISPTQSQKRLKSSQFKNKTNSGCKSNIVESESRASIEIEIQYYGNDDVPMDQSLQNGSDQIRKNSSQLGIGKLGKESLNIDSARSSLPQTNDISKKTSSFPKATQPPKLSQNIPSSSSQSLKLGQIKPITLSRFNLKTPAVKSDHRILDRQIILGVKDQANRELQNMRQKREEFGIFNLKKISNSGLGSHLLDESVEHNGMSTARFKAKNLNINASSQNEGGSGQLQPTSALLGNKLSQRGLNKNNLDPNSRLGLNQNPIPTSRTHLSYQRSSSTKRSLPKQEDEEEEDENDSEERDDEDEEMVSDDEIDTSKAADQHLQKQVGDSKNQSRLKPGSIGNIQKKQQSYIQGSSNFGVGGLVSPQLRGRGGVGVGSKISVNSRGGLLGVSASPLQKKKPDDSPAAKSNASKKSARGVKNSVKTEKLMKHFTLGKKQNTLLGSKMEEEEDGEGSKGKKQRQKSSSEESQKEMEQDDYGERHHQLHDEEEEEQLISSPDESSPDFKLNKSTLQKPQQASSNVRRISQSRNKILQLEKIGNNTESPGFKQSSILKSPHQNQRSQQDSLSNFKQASEKQRIIDFSPSSSNKIPIGSLGLDTRNKEDLLSLDDEVAQ